VQQEEEAEAVQRDEVVQYELDDIARETIEEIVKQAEEKSRSNTAKALEQAETRMRNVYEEQVAIATQELEEKVAKAKKELEEGTQQAATVIKREARELITHVRRSAEESAGREALKRIRQRRALWDDVGGFALNDAAREYCAARWREEIVESGTADSVVGRKVGDVAGGKADGVAGGKLIKVDYAVIRRATNNFSEATHLIGKGGCCQVFKAQVYGHECAIKVFNETEGQEAWDNKQIKTEINMLNAIRHPHINRLLAASFNGPKRCLLLEFMNGGALDVRLRIAREPSSSSSHTNASKRKQPLGWEERLTVLLHTARGLAHLHSLDPPIIHRDVKCGNSLLNYDDQGRLIAKVGGLVGSKRTDHIFIYIQLSIICLTLI
jgi:hypothetical protein